MTRAHPTFNTQTSYWFGIKFKFSLTTFWQDRVAHTLLSAVSHWLKQSRTQEGSRTTLIPSRHSCNLVRIYDQRQKNNDLPNLHLKPYSKVVPKSNLAMLWLFYMSSNHLHSLATERLLYPSRISTSRFPSQTGLQLPISPS